jgi:hypothetical protein
VRGESALPHLAERHEGEHLSPVERDVGEPLDVDDVADEHVEGRFVLTMEHGEGFGIARGEEGAEQARHGILRSGPGRAAAQRETTALGRSSYVEKRVDPPRRRATSSGSTWSA